MTKSKEINFEEALKELDANVRTLEGGTLTLDESLQVFEAGTTLARVCEQKLSEAKGKVEKLLAGSDGALVTEEFTGDGV